MESATVLAFLAVAALAYLTPGPDWFVVMGHAATSRRNGWVAAAGVQSGLVVHILAAAAGVSAIMVASAQAFLMLKLAGAAYLVYLGVRALRDSWTRPKSASAEDQDHDKQEARTGWAPVWRQSFTANVLNPKAALFFVAVLPQFLSSDSAIAPQVLLLGVLDIALGLVWWSAFVVGVRGLRTVMGARRSRVVIDRVSGVALIGLGGLLATTGRRA